MNQTSRKPILFPKPIPKTEVERVDEAMSLLMKVTEEDLGLFTTWELEMINNIREGRAVTRIVLGELREAMKRLKKI